MKISCDKATAICDKSQYGEATFWERLKLSLHLVLCKRCGLYSKQNIVLSKCLKKHKEFKKNIKCCLSEDEKTAMEVTLKDKKS